MGGTHIVIFRWVDLLDEPLDDLLLVEPLGVRNKVGLRSLTPPWPRPTPSTRCCAAYIDHILPQLGPLHAREEAQQQVHDGRRANVLQQQVHKVVLLPQEGHELGAQACQMAGPGLHSPTHTIAPGWQRAPGPSCD